MNWMQVNVLARESYRTAVNEWIGGARLYGGKVNGPALTAGPGSLRGTTDIEQRMMQSLHGVAPSIARNLAHVLASAWKMWADGFQLRAPHAFPTLAAVPGPIAKSAPTVPIALRHGVSQGEVALQSAALTRALVTALRPQAQSVPGNFDEAMRALASWVEISFRDWRNTVMLTNLIGGGQVPAFAPPYVPVGPVSQGDVVNSGPLFMGPRFGLISM